MPLVGIVQKVESGCLATAPWPEEIMAMKNSMPDGYHSITPYFTVRDANKLIEFLVTAFEATIVIEKRYSNDTIQHARVRIGDSIVMLNETTEVYPANVSQMHLYVEDADITFSKALQAGATALMEPNNRPHGDRMAGVKDPCGNIWWIASLE